MTSLNSDERKQFLVRFAYRGERFYGVQEQPQLNTVLGTLRKRIEEALDQKARALFVAARTDRGVHALENYATFYIKALVDIPIFFQKMRMHRNDGLYALSIASVSAKVHARGNARSKIYRYYLQDDVDCAKFNGLNRMWAIAPKLDISAMRHAALYLVGKQDFSSLRGGGCQAGSPYKEIFSIDIERSTSGVIAIEICGDSFLRKMIRNAVGLLVEIGAQLRPPESMVEILAKRDRMAAGIMAPAYGLYLIKVNCNQFVENIFYHPQEE